MFNECLEIKKKKIKKKNPLIFASLMNVAKLFRKRYKGFSFLFLSCLERPVLIDLSLATT